MDYCPRRMRRFDTARSVFRSLDELLRVAGGFVDEDSLSFIAGADMAVLDAAKAFRFCFIALYSFISNCSRWPSTMYYSTRGRVSP